MKLQRGFTLIELLVTIAIIGILAAIAIPNYTEFVRRGRVAEASQTLTDLRLRMENRYGDNRSYATAGAGSTACAIPAPTSVDNFTFTCVLSNTVGYTWTATGTGSASPVVFTIDGANAKTTTGIYASWLGTNTLPVARWILKNGG